MVSTKLHCFDDNQSPLLSISTHKINAIEKAFSAHRFHILFELTIQESSLKRRKYFNFRKSLKGQLLVSHYQINLQNERRDEYKTAHEASKHLTDANFYTYTYRSQPYLEFDFVYSSARSLENKFWRHVVKNVSQRPSLRARPGKIIDPSDINNCECTQSPDIRISRS